MNKQALIQRHLEEVRYLRRLAAELLAIGSMELYHDTYRIARSRIREIRLDLLNPEGTINRVLAPCLCGTCMACRCRIITQDTIDDAIEESHQSMRYSFVSSRGA